MTIGTRPGWNVRAVRRGRGWRRIRATAFSACPGSAGRPENRHLLGFYGYNLFVIPFNLVKRRFITKAVAKEKSFMYPGKKIRKQKNTPQFFLPKNGILFRMKQDTLRKKKRLLCFFGMLYVQSHILIAANATSFFILSTISRSFLHSGSLFNCKYFP